MSPTRRQIIQAIIDDLEGGRTPVLDVVDFPCFSQVSTSGNPHIGPDTAQRIAAGLTAADIPTFKRAIEALEDGDVAWIGFKVVFDGDAAVQNVDNDVTGKYGQTGSADGQDTVFFCNDAGQIVTARPRSPRDTFQMKDVTRGPAMHNEQFDGLTWCAVPLFDQVRVWLLGASDAASEVAALAHHVRFAVTAVDYDAQYLNEERFPHAERILIDSFDDMSDLHAEPEDYVCVLTRGHMFDPQACLWSVAHKVHYVGMMGCAGKNSTVQVLCEEHGMTEAQWDTIKRPIGLKFGAKTPAELAIAIVGELVDVRYKQRYSIEAQKRHETDLGR